MSKRFALAGNPNSGKTTLFNSLTGSTAHVGNWPGVTVDKKEGSYKKLDEEIDIIDLPGIYSLSPYTSEEVVSRNYILDEKPDCIINIVDATNIERNLYLTTQLLEIDIPMVVALNMSDVLRKRGDSIKIDKLSKSLGVPVVEISALKAENIDELMKVAYEASKHKREGSTVIEDKELLSLLSNVKAAFEAQNVAYPLFHAIKLIELDELEAKDHRDIAEMVMAFKKFYKNETFGSDFEALVADARYNYICNHFMGAFVSKEKAAGISTKERQLTTSEKIDRVLTHRIWSLPIFVFIMFLVFHFTFGEALFFIPVHMEGAAADFFSGMSGEPVDGIPSLGVFLQSWFGWFTDSLIIDNLRNVMPEAWYTSFLLDGMLGGVSAVLSFVPQIMLLFFFIAILEDSGYMARIAFILDRAFKKFGLSGRAFIPMLTGFGCSVPAIMATRTLGDDREKRLTIRLMTCFSCGAKAPIWAFLAGIGAMMGAAGDIFVFAIYLGGIAAAIIFALFLKLFSKEHYVAPFVMELPEYHLPQARNVLALLWDKLKHYVVKACTIILACTIVIWFFSNFGWDFWYNNAFNESLHDATFSFGGDVYPYFVEVMNEEGEMELAYNMEWSILGTLGQGLKFFFYPLGCLEGGWTYGADGWKYSVATITGLIAKEDVVATMAVLGLDEGSVALNIAGAYSFAVYNLFTIPCFAAIGAAHGELKGKHFWLTLLWWFAMSYAAALIVYWIGEAYVFQWWLGLIITLVLAALIVSCGFVVSKRQKGASALRA